MPVWPAACLLSMDRGWYSPGQPGGGLPKPFTYLPDCFLPGLRESFDESSGDPIDALF